VNRILKSAILSLVLLCLFAGICMAGARPVAGERFTVRRVAVILLPATTLSDLLSADMPNTGILIKGGALGLMNSRTPGRPDGEAPESYYLDYNPQSAYVTLGAGARAVAGVDARYAFNRDENVLGISAKDILFRRTLTGADDARIIHTGIAKLVHDQESLNYSITVGALGSALKAAEMKTAVIGNSDDGTPRREAVAVCMDGRGRVDLGDVGPLMSLPSPLSPLGFRTNTPRLLLEAERCIPQAELTVIELGDTARADRARPYTMDAVYKRNMSAALKEADRVIGKLTGIAAKNGALIVLLSPYPPSSVMAKTKNSLCPVVVFGEGFPSGLILSGSTRTAGICTNADIAPSILGWLGVPSPKEFMGRCIAVKGCPDAAGYLLWFNNRAGMQVKSYAVVRQVVVATIVFVVLFTLLWFLIPFGPGRRTLSTLALLPPSVAPALFFAALLPTGSIVVAWLQVLVFSALLVWGALLIMREELRALMLISGIFTVAVALDLLCGGMLSRFSILGYSVVDGARYYGLGNELMGALLGGSLLAVCVILYSVKAARGVARIVLACGLAAAVAVIGSPMVGANMGGAISVVAAFGVALAATSGQTLNLRRVLLIVLGVAAVLSVFAGLDMLRGPENESHLGRALRLMCSGGPEHIWLIIKRKLAMNFMLVRFSGWSRLILAYVASLAAILALSDKNKKPWPLPYYLRVAVLGIAAASAAAFIFNDSGVVAAGTCLGYAWSMLVILAARAADGKPAR
jgi:hypothetical protein